MPLTVPNLDDRNFDEIVDEARELIARFAPAWTDHNLSNVGPTLIDLVAWIVDQQIWATGFLSDAHIEAFAALLGERVEAAQPATGLVWPDAGAIDSDGTLGGADVAAGATLKCIAQPEMGFVLARDTHISRAQLMQWSMYDGTVTREFSAADSPQQDKPVTVQTLDGLVAPIVLRFDRPVVELLGDTSGFPVAIGIELLDNGSARGTLKHSPGSVTVDYRIADTGLWRRIDVDHDGTHTLTRSGVLRVRLPALAHNPAKLKHEIRISTRNRVHPLPPAITRIALNVAEVRQCEIRTMRVIGDPSSGDPDQRYDLALQGLVHEAPIRIEVAEDGAMTEWSRVADLSAAHAGSRVFAVSSAHDQIVFGNGVNGMIPPKGAQIRHLDYSLTEGTDGNLARDLGWHFPAAPLSLSAQRFGENRSALTGGRNRTSLDELRRRARSAAVQRDVLLTDEALESAARSILSLALEDVHVLPRHDPSMPCRSVPGNRSVVLTPKRSPGSDAATPVPGRYVQAARNALRDHRVLGERLHIVGSERIVVKARARLWIEDGFDSDAVVEEVRQRLNARLSDVRTEPGIEPWPVGRDVTVGEIRALIACVDGVITVTGLRIARRGDDWRKGRIPIPADAIAVAGAHDIKSKRRAVA